MEKNELEGYLEFASHLVNFNLNTELATLCKAAEESQIHTFGWPIGVVMEVDNYKPKPIQNGIRAIIDTEDSFDYWTLDKNGNYYILKSIFEDSTFGGKKPEKQIYIDTRTIRTAELFLRTAMLYKSLGVPDSEEIVMKLEYGGLMNRVLAAANPMRAISSRFIKRKCSVNEVVKKFQEPIKNIFDQKRLKELVFDTVKSITEMCDMFVPSKELTTDPLVEEFLKGRLS